MSHLPFLVNGQVVVKNQAQAQVMSQTRPSPPASTRARLHHPTYALWLKVWKAMQVMMTPTLFPMKSFLT